MIEVVAFLVVYQVITKFNYIVVVVNMSVDKSIKSSFKSSNQRFIGNGILINNPILLMTINSEQEDFLLTCSGKDVSL